MKSFFFLLLCFSCLLFPLGLKSQSYIYAVHVGNAIELNVTGANGTIQWQESTDSLNWTNIAGATTSPYTLNAVASPSGNRYFRAVITNATICQNSSWYSTVVRYRIVSTSSQVQVGDWYRGGVVFSVDGSGNGLIAPTEDQAVYGVFGCESAGYNPGAVSTSNGQANTTAIVNACSERPIAASLCNDLVHLGYSDWFLPAIDQLVLMLNNKNIIGNFPPVQTSGGITNCYFSSTTGYDTWNNSSYVKIGVLSTSGGYASMSYLGASDYVRAIRAFTASGPVATTASTVTVPFQPESVTMITQPVSKNICKGSSVSFSATAFGTSISHQWKKDGVPITGATYSWYNLTNTDVSKQGVYTCDITNLCTTVTSNSATLNVVEINADAGSDIVFCNDNPVQLTGAGMTNNPSVSGTLSYEWTPATGLSDQYIAGTTAQPMADQTYVLTVRDGLNCWDRDTVTLTSNTPVSLLSQTNSLNKCIDSEVNFEVTVQGTSPVFQWKKDGDDITGANEALFSISNAELSDEGIYTCQISNACNTISTVNAELKVIQLTIDAGADDRICLGEGMSLNALANTNHVAESGNLSFLWSPSDSLSSSIIANPVANPSYSHNYSVIVTDNIGCSVSDNIYITVGTPYQNQQLCLVTVDTLTGKNKVMWEKVLNVGIKKFKIFKESGTNNFVEIGEVDASLPGEFTDVNSVPEVHADRYKIMVVDTCDNLSALSPYHKTVNLVLSANASTMGLNWTAYIDASGSFVPSSYFIYRGTSPANMSLLATVNGSTLSYNDINVFDSYYYMIGVKKADGCEINGVIDTVSFSNKKDNAAFVGMYSNLMLSGTIEIFPNPMSTSTTLSIPNLQSPIYNPQSAIRIFDVTGKLVRIEPLSSYFSGSSGILREASYSERDEPAQIKLLRGDLKSGIYFVEINADRVYRGKLIVE
ncbi:MAG: hypothetical protein CVU05_01470 [Bacteroidetes bacterium HGW-Bacteroidetes-21]|jgi:hypothetical protein|nr:MAG: hypothetical protein CVU05_01470 [Bacteroidetes bacterium HGW-Bacteroidetes-21]